MKNEKALEFLLKEIGENEDFREAVEYVLDEIRPFYGSYEPHALANALEDLFGIVVLGWIREDDESEHFPCSCSDEDDFPCRNFELADKAKDDEIKLNSYWFLIKKKRSG